LLPLVPTPIIGIHAGCGTVSVRIRTRIFWIFGAVFLLFLLVFLDLAGIPGALLVPVLGDAMDWRTRYLAGWRGVDCGRVRIGEDATEASQCALKAQSDGRPFHVVYNVQGIDSRVAGAIVRTSSGQLLALSYDSCPSGCGGTSFLGQRVSVSRCPEPNHLFLNPKARLNCYQAGLSTPSNIMSPNIEPY
jgi:hypothetical protein